MLAWNLATRALTATLPHPQPVTSLAWDGTGRLAAGDADGTVSLWTLPTPVLVTGIAYSPEGTRIAIARSDGTAWLLDARTLRPAGPAFSVSAAGNAESVAFSPDGKLLATAGDDGTVRLWSLADPGRPRQLATVHDSGTYVYTVVFAPDGRTLAAASTDNLTRLWDVSDPAHPAQVGTPLIGPTGYV